MSTARQNREITLTGMRLDLNKPSDMNPPAKVPTGPARSNMLPRNPELAVPVPSRSLMYTGDQYKSRYRVGLTRKYTAASSQTILLRKTSPTTFHEPSGSRLGLSEGSMTASFS